MFLLTHKTLQNFYDKDKVSALTQNKIWRFYHYYIIGCMYYQKYARKANATNKFIFMLYVYQISSVSQLIRTSLIRLYP